MKEQLLPTLWLIGISLSTGVLGQTALKLGVSQPSTTGLTITDPVALIGMILRSPLILLGLVLYALGALSWIVVLSRLDLSYAYPFIALNFVLIAFVSRLFFAEAIPGPRWLGIGFICVGIILVARSAPVS